MNREMLGTGQTSCSNVKVSSLDLLPFRFTCSDQKWVEGARQIILA